MPGPPLPARRKMPTPCCGQSIGNGSTIRPPCLPGSSFCVSRTATRRQRNCLPVAARCVGKDQHQRMVERATHHCPRPCRPGRCPLRYTIVAAHSARSTTDIVDAEFHAGWYALRGARRSTHRLPPFRKDPAGVDRPLSASRALYWLGRAAEAGGRAKRRISTSGPPATRPPSTASWQRQNSI